MQEITPAYYANTTPTGSYELIGDGFGSIPSNAIGIWASNNNNPLQWLNSSSPNLLFNIDIVDDGRMTAIPQRTLTHTTDGYLGAIVSADRQTIYWVNNTQPLP